MPCFVFIQNIRIKLPKPALIISYHLKSIVFHKRLKFVLLFFLFFIFLMSELIEYFLCIFVHILHVLSNYKYNIIIYYDYLFSLSSLCIISWFNSGNILNWTLWSYLFRTYTQLTQNEHFSDFYSTYSSSQIRFTTSLITLFINFYWYFMSLTIFFLAFHAS